MQISIKQESLEARKRRDKTMYLFLKHKPIKRNKPSAINTTFAFGRGFVML